MTRMNQPASISENLARVSEKIQHAAQSVGRDGDAVRLIVVTKGHPIDVVEQAVEAGASNLGENYVKESLPKMTKFPKGKNLKWHMIGHIQSRK